MNGIHLKFKDQMASVSGNDKRKASCKAIGGEKKRTGHAREDAFGERWCDPTATTYKAEADKMITDPVLLARLRESLGVPVIGRTSIKSGKNLQFTLGRIDELSESTDKLSAIRNRALWEKYLAKSESASPADVLCYRGPTSWTFFSMNAVLDFIMKDAKWRELSTGRIKGDFMNKQKNKVTQYLTYEYRTTHKSHFLGANGNKGREFIELLTMYLPHHVETD